MAVQDDRDGYDGRFWRRMKEVPTTQLLLMAGPGRKERESVLEHKKCRRRC